VVEGTPYQSLSDAAGALDVPNAFVVEGAAFVVEGTPYQSFSGAAGAGAGGCVG